MSTGVNSLTPECYFCNIWRSKFLLSTQWNIGWIVSRKFRHLWFDRMYSSFSSDTMSLKCVGHLVHTSFARLRVSCTLIHTCIWLSLKSSFIQTMMFSTFIVMHGVSYSVSQFSDSQDAEQDALCVGVRHEQFREHGPPECPHSHRHQQSAARHHLAGTAAHTSQTFS